jgi:hypothetical protein
MHQLFWHSLSFLIFLYFINYLRKIVEIVHLKYFVSLLGYCEPIIKLLLVSEHLIT